jgi:hypothetical protein
MEHGCDDSDQIIGSHAAFQSHDDGGQLVVSTAWLRLPRRESVGRVSCVCSLNDADITVVDKATVESSARQKQPPARPKNPRQVRTCLMMYVSRAHPSPAGCRTRYAHANPSDLSGCLRTLPPLRTKRE